MDAEQFVVRQSRVSFIVSYMLLGLGLFPLSAILVPYLFEGFPEGGLDDNESFGLMMGIIVTSLGSFLVVIVSRWRMRASNREIIFTPYLGKTRAIRLFDVKHIRPISLEPGFTAFDKNRKKLFTVLLTCRGYLPLADAISPYIDNSWEIPRPFEPYPAKRGSAKDADKDADEDTYKDTYENIWPDADETAEPGDKEEKIFITGLSYTELIKLYTDSCKTINKIYKLSAETVSHHIFTPLIPIGNGDPLDIDKVKACREIINNFDTNKRGRFRFFGNLSYASLLLLTPDPAETFQKTYEIYLEMLRYGFKDSHALTYAALEIAAAGRQPRQYLEVFDRMAIYSSDLGDEPDGSACSVAVALSVRDPGRSARRAKMFYKELEKHFKNKNSARILAELLMLAGAPGDAVPVIVKIAAELKTFNLKFDQKLTLPSLALLYMVSLEGPLIIDEYKTISVKLANAAFSKKIIRDPQTIPVVAVVLLAYSRGLRPGTAALIRTLIILYFALSNGYNQKRVGKILSLRNKFKK